MPFLETLVDRAVFRAYDVRGIIDEHFSENAYYTIGRAISLRLLELKRTCIFLGRDGRLTSNSLAAALQAGLLDSGIDVVDIGAVATPVMYYAVNSQDIDSGLMVTGSHNAADYNGIKIVLAGKTLVNQDIELLYDLVQKGQFHNGTGQYTQVNLLSDYTTRVLQDIRLSRPLKVVVDCGNGIAGPVIPQVLTALGCEVIPLYCEVDGNFPNHHPDPTIEENLRDLKAMVALHHADIGLAFDGDADRLGVVCNLGKVIWPDRLIMFYARHMLQNLPGGIIVFDVKCSSNLPRVIRESGGVAQMCPTGHSIVKAVMKTSKAILAGEMSGHIFFKDGWYGFDDALYSACRLLEMLSQSPLTAGEQFAAIPDSFNTPEILIPIQENEKFMFMEQFVKIAEFNDASIISIDGLRAEFPKGWGLVRASNTSPYLVARFEAEDEASLEKIKQLFKTQLLRVNAAVQLPF